jgi:hypothetical protein
VSVRISQRETHNYFFLTTSSRLLLRTVLSPLLCGAYTFWLYGQKTLLHLDSRYLFANRSLRKQCTVTLDIFTACLLRTLLLASSSGRRWHAVRCLRRVTVHYVPNPRFAGLYTLSKCMKAFSDGISRKCRPIRAVDLSRDNIRRQRIGRDRRPRSSNERESPSDAPFQSTVHLISFSFKKIQIKCCFFWSLHFDSFVH